MNSVLRQTLIGGLLAAVTGLSGFAQEGEASIFRRPLENRVTVTNERGQGLKSVREEPVREVEEAAVSAAPVAEVPVDPTMAPEPGEVPAAPVDPEAPVEKKAADGEGKKGDAAEAAPPAPPVVSSNTALSDFLNGKLRDTASGTGILKKASGNKFQSNWATTQGARILNLSIPAPRGQIVDRNGSPLAQNVVVTYLGLNFPYMEGQSDDQKIAYARERLTKANELLGKAWTLDDSDILDHYKNRRWLPLVFSRLPLPEDDRMKIEQLAMPGLILLPTYQRMYPQQQLAGHIVGYVGRKPPWPKGDVPDGESMWPTAQGVQGLEKSFDKQLTGIDGRVRIIFNERGERVEEELIRAPVPGLNVVTTIDLEMQKLAEKLTEKHVRRGAFVLMEVQTGDILAMASYPRYDPNEFVPTISTDRFSALNTDPEQPLLGRAFQGEYPPASTFKVFSALGLLHAGTVTESSIYDCPNAFTIGDRIARNWNEQPEGGMNVIGALARSCNTWFFQGSMETDPPFITGMGVEFGFGRRSGIPIEESSGLMPTNEWWIKQYGAKIGRGDLCNISIGQGSVLATPLQVAQAMTGVANRHSLAQARLILQLQDYRENIVDQYDVVARELHVPPRNLDIVHRGMYEVVNSERGTGKNAAHEQIHVSGKTGTGQWKPNKSQNIAWFAGFAPSETPVYAFAAVYEGEPGEKIGGGSKAAPIVGDFFREYLTEPRLVALQELSDQIQLREPGRVPPSEDSSLSAIYYGGPPVDPLAGMTPPPQQAKKPAQPSIFRALFGPKKQGR